ncbi:UBX domain-containing protein 6-like [Lineus longissimus]|uniref:UBX domain-containing protein 6-like n=1 Tax=Lineus longissimus TaxID=88925 RepID=UPI00315DE50C
MAAIKRFFEKKKLDIKFKKAGGAHSLTEEKKPTVQASSSKALVRVAPAASAQRAGEAALERFTQPPKTSRPKTSSYSSQEAEVRRQIESEQNASAQMQAAAAALAGPKEVYNESAPVLQCQGVFFKCPMVGPEVLTKSEMEAKIHEFLLLQLAEVPDMASALMIHTLNKNKDKVRVCIETLCKYLDNLIANPSEEKFRKIRIGNKIFQERVEGMEGTEEFLQSIGFVRKVLPFQDAECDFYVMDEELANNKEKLKSAKELLQDAEPIVPELDRGLRVFYGIRNIRLGAYDLPPEFYNVSPEELKREQQIRTEAVEKLGMLRTKAMREADEKRELRRYRYTLLRVRFPDNIILQGTFRAQEKCSALFEFVREHLDRDWVPFHLAAPTGHKLAADDKTMAELGLAPAAVISFSWDADVLAEITAQIGSSQTPKYLKDEVLAQVEDISTA